MDRFLDHYPLQAIEGAIDSGATGICLDDRHRGRNHQARIRFRASDMILQVGSDAAFQVRPMARSRAGGHHHLGSKNNDLFNAPILALSKVIKGAMDSAAEAEVAAIHLNAKEAVAIRHTWRKWDIPNLQPESELMMQSHKVLLMALSNKKEAELSIGDSGG